MVRPGSELHTHAHPDELVGPEPAPALDQVRLGQDGLGGVIDIGRNEGDPVGGDHFPVLHDPHGQSDLQFSGLGHRHAHVDLERVVLVHAW